MNGLSKQAANRGFTIVETLIVLAVTGFLFIAAATVIAGRQNVSQFSQAVNSVQTQLQQVINDVGSGFYPNDETILCTAQPNGNGVDLEESSAVPQGTNQECIFLGKAVQFFDQSVATSPDASPEQFNVYTIAGLRNNASSTSSVNLDEAKPKVIASGNGSPNVPDVFDAKRLLYGLTVVDMYYDGDPSNSGKKIGAVGFTSSLGSLGQTDTSQQVNLLAVGGTMLTADKPSGVKDLNDNLITSVVNPPGGVQICFKSGGTNQSALMTIGGSGRQMAVKTVVKASLNCS